MRLNYTGILSHKPDSSLNDLMFKIKQTETEQRTDAFVAYKQGLIQKNRLVELIAQQIQGSDK